MNNKITKILVYIILTIGAILTVLPLLWMVVTSFKSMEEVFTVPIQWIPKEFKFLNYTEVFAVMDFAQYYFNTIVVTISRICGLFLTATMAGYAFAKLRFPGRNFLFMLLLMTLMVPIHTIMYPAYQVISELGMINSYQGLIIPQMLGAFGGAFSIFLIKQGFESIPNELMEAAKVDGAGIFRTFFQVMLPQIKPVLASFFIFSFNSSWNDYIYPLIVVNDDNMKTLSLGLAGFTSMREGLTNYPLMMAAAVMTLLPVIILFVAAQKYFIESAVASGLKG
ncbi:hypothetical protein AN639_10875 [Candidatus Epulonipiscium fishelsonii]|uniref:Uncharacterized protein n=1 Tax=Candidatus Epulonipiscium fishelsonii TaxID=77094 RepID=A0ACC8XE62_9FIRM|nr:hypothetical protein AN396_03675 [Epulopiscium sp. SCG-B11WGA-EpuloA1]ONI43235.1 hypothetical protein AN639_10875 [Epulopiscium sp. SCG-B05WGA-EpuloA1]